MASPPRALAPGAAVAGIKTEIAQDTQPVFCLARWPVELKHGPMAKRAAFGRFAIEVALRIAQQSVRRAEAVGADFIAEGMKHFQFRLRLRAVDRRERGSPECSANRQ